MFAAVDEQLTILLRGAAQVETVAELKQKLERSYKTNTPLRIKYGIDPTGFDVHLGHTVPLRKLRQFQELGHTAVLIIGTATAQVGDPSGRDSSRVGLTTEQIAKNAESYLIQIAKVVDVTKAEVRPNADWFGKWGFTEMLKLLGQSTVQQILAREDFANRVKSGTAIYLHECLYPLMQGWDSVEITADVELGGTEQLFNLMVGRDLQKSSGQEAQVPMTMPILRGLDGVKKMGKSLNNYIGVGESSKEQFGKTMRIPDDLMREWYTLLTGRTDANIAEMLAGKPNEAKKRLGADIVTWFHGEAAANEVLADWKKQFEEKGDPDHIELVKISTRDYELDAVSSAEFENFLITAQKLLVLAGLAKSKGEARKKIEEGAFNYGPDRVKLQDWKSVISVPDGTVLRLGRKIVRVSVSGPSISCQNGTFTFHTSSSSMVTIVGNLQYSPKLIQTSGIGVTFDNQPGQMGRYTQHLIYKRRRNDNPVPPSAGIGILGAGTNWTIVSHIKHYYSTQRFHIVRTDGQVIPPCTRAPNTYVFSDGKLRGFELLNPDVNATFKDLPELPLDLKWGFEANPQRVTLFVHSHSGVNRGSGVWKNSSGDNNWTTNYSQNNNWEFGIPCAETHIATFDKNVVNYHGGVVHLDKCGQTIGGIVLADSGSGGYRIGTPGGKLIVEQSTVGSTSVRLASPLHACLRVGHSILGSHVVSIKGQYVELADPVPAGYELSNVEVDFGNTLSLKNYMLDESSNSVPAPSKITVLSGVHCIAAPVNLTNDLLVDVDNLDCNLSIEGELTNDFGIASKLHLTGRGTVEFNAVIANTGTIVCACTLRGIGAITSSKLIVTALATLGAGTKEHVGCLTLKKGLNLQELSILHLRIRGASDNHDRISVEGGDIQLDSVKLSVSLQFDPAPTDMFWVLINHTGKSVQGIFDGLEQFATVKMGHYMAQISYQGDNLSKNILGGNDIVLFNLMKQ